MILESLLNKVAVNLHKYFKNTRIMAENLRSPNSFFFGFIAKRLMLVGNQKVIEDSVQRLNIKREDKVLEIVKELITTPEITLMNLAYKEPMLLVALGILANLVFESPL